MKWRNVDVACGTAYWPAAIITTFEGVRISPTCNFWLDAHRDLVYLKAAWRSYTPAFVKGLPT